jgi:copper chaperone
MTRHNCIHFAKGYTIKLFSENRMETLKIKGMSCQHCVGAVKKALENVAGLSRVSVDLAAGEATFENNGADRRTIREAISKIGFEPGE